MAEKLSYRIQLLPTEILMQIFKCLPVVKVVNIRRVCTRWKDVIDIMMSESFWLQSCVQDYKHMFNSIRHRIQSDISYFSLYKTLRLWPMVSQARVVQEELIPLRAKFQVIQDFCLLPDNIVGVHEECGITYYDLPTFTKCNQISLPGRFRKYLENTDIILLHELSKNSLKMIYKKDQKPNLTLSQVTQFLLTDNKLYYVRNRTDIFACKYLETQLSTYIGKMSDNVYCLGYNDDTLYLLTFDIRIFKVLGKNITLECSLVNSPNIMHSLNQYNLLEYVYSDWKSRLIPFIPDRTDLCCIYIYGDIIFVGSKWGILQIFYKPYIDGVFDIFNSKPAIQLYIGDPKHKSFWCFNPILAINVVEAISEHIVFVGVPQKIYILKLVHNL